MSLAPIAIFGYRRPRHLARLLESLRANPEQKQSPIHVFLDGARGAEDAEDVARTRAIVRAQAPQHAEIVARDANAGLANSIIAGVTRLTQEYGCAIVLEDDLVLSPYALRYFNEALQRYRDAERAMHVSGYMFPVRARLPETFFYREATCWGWATWARAWAKFEPDGRKIREYLLAHGMVHEFDVRGSMRFRQMLEHQIAGLNDSWAIRWYGSLRIAGGLSLHPAQSLVENRGFDGSGRHNPETTMFDVRLAAQPVTRFTERIEECEEAVAAMIAYRRRTLSRGWRLADRVRRALRKAMRPA
jgi:hypothetical protein